MRTTVKVNMQPVGRIITRLGVNKNGDVQHFVTATVNRRLTRYMPYRSGALATKLKFVSGPSEITVLGPYARYQYYGKVMVDPVTKAAGFQDADGQWKSRRGVAKVLTDRDLDYSLSRQKNPRAGPFWDKRMMTAEGAQIAMEIQAYVNRRKNT